MRARRAGRKAATPASGHVLNVDAKRSLAFAVVAIQAEDRRLGWPFTCGRQTNDEPIGIGKAKRLQQPCVGNTEYRNGRANRERKRQDDDD